MKNTHRIPIYGCDMISFFNIFEKIYSKVLEVISRDIKRIFNCTQNNLKFSKSIPKFGKNTELSFGRNKSNFEFIKLNEGHCFR